MTSYSRPGSMVPSLRAPVLMIAVTALATWLSAGADEEKAPTAASIAAVTKTTSPPRRPLDLRAPNITHLYSSEQLNKILATTFRDDIEEVQVEGERDRRPTDTPNVWPGIAAPIWALLNPAQSWRIFAPLPPDQTRGLEYVRANATDAYVLEPAATPSPHAH